MAIMLFSKAFCGKIGLFFMKTLTFLSEQFPEIRIYHLPAARLPQMGLHFKNSHETLIRDDLVSQRMPNTGLQSPDFDPFVSDSSHRYIYCDFTPQTATMECSVSDLYL